MDNVKASKITLFVAEVVRLLAAALAGFFGGGV